MELWHSLGILSLNLVTLYCKGLISHWKQYSWSSVWLSSWCSLLWDLNEVPLSYNSQQKLCMRMCAGYAHELSSYLDLGSPAGHSGDVAHDVFCCHGFPSSTFTTEGTKEHHPKLNTIRAVGNRDVLSRLDSGEGSQKLGQKCVVRVLKPSKTSGCNHQCTSGATAG